MCHVSVIEAQCYNASYTFILLNVSMGTTFCSINSPYAFSQSQMNVRTKYMEAGLDIVPWVLTDLRIRSGLCSIYGFVSYSC